MRDGQLTGPLAEGAINRGLFHRGLTTGLFATMSQCPNSPRHRFLEFTVGRLVFLYQYGEMDVLFQKKRAAR